MLWDTPRQTRLPRGGGGARRLFLVCAMAVFGLGLIAQTAPGHPVPLTISVLSNRADAVSGGDALVRVDGTHAAAATLRLNGAPVSGVSLRPDGNVEGIVSGMRPGANLVTAHARGDGSARVVVTNHAIQGPVFSGPHQEPFYCQNGDNGLAGPLDEDCSAPTAYSYSYKSSTTGSFGPYDPAHPPVDVATVTVHGHTVPYIVRVESGAINRGAYQIAVLYDPDATWAPWAPQPTWSHKLVLEFGGGCGAGHVQGAGASALLDTPLSMGYAVATSTLMTTGNDCNTTLIGETAMMVKEHFIESYGVPRFTMGDGCSGGSLSQHEIAERYPGILDGLNTQCSFMDFNSLQWQTQADCALLSRYFAQAPAGLWTQPAIDAAEGRPAFDCLVQSNAGTQNVYNPVRSVNWGCSSVVPDAAIYDPLANPGGIRCTWQDDAINMMGRRPASVWTPAEQTIGSGFANRPLDNVGVQYGLNALEAGDITLAQFVDLNANIGGVDIDLNHTAARTSADPAAVRRAYANGLVTSGKQQANVPIIDFADDDPTTAFGHEQVFAYVVRARLQTANGTSANQLIWRQNTGLDQMLIDAPLGRQAFKAMDGWLDAISADTSRRTPAQKVIADKPPGLGDRCFVAATEQSLSTCDQQFPVHATPRMGAGETLAQDVVRCSLVALRRRDYPGITADQWTRLQAAFPTGVCDWSRPSQDGRPLRGTWLTYADGPDGVPLKNAR